MDVDLRERRRHRRYRLRHRGVAMVSPDLVFSYTVEDISRGGLAFTYTGWHQWRQPARLSFLDRRFFLDKVGVEVVDDREFAEEVEPEVPFVSLRRCAVRFTDLSESQARELEAYLQRMAEGE